MATISGIMKILVINEPFIQEYCRCQRWPAKDDKPAMGFYKLLSILSNFTHNSKRCQVFFEAGVKTSPFNPLDRTGPSIRVNPRCYPR
jgi:hypothetical protein